MTRTADTSIEILPVLRERWSPWAFDRHHQLSDDHLRSLIEAARWTPSSSNSQPWRFIVGRRNDPTFAAIFERLNSGNQLWAGNASALIVAVGATTDDTGHVLTHTDYDVGAAVTQLVVQAHGLELHAHQIGGFEADRLTEAFSIPSNWIPRAVVAIGALGNHDDLPDKLKQRFSTPRQRLAVEDLAFSGVWGESAL